METDGKQFSEEFKRDAVEPSLTSEKSVEEIARDLGIREVFQVPWEMRVALRIRYTGSDFKSP